MLLLAAAIAPLHAAEGQQPTQGNQAVSENTKNLGSPSKIGKKWRSSSEYQEFLLLGGERSEKAKSLMDKTMTRIVQEESRLYIASFEPKYQSLMGKKIEGLSLGLQALLAEINLNLRPLLVGIKSPRDISRFNTYLYQYVESIEYDKGIAKAKTDDLIALFPELQGKEATKYFMEVGQVYDNIAKYKRESAEYKRESAAWEKIIRKLGGLP